MFREKTNIDEIQEISEILDALYKTYKHDILPVEKNYLFNEFHSPFLCEADFKALPMVLLIGQYSTGKTSFIKHMLDEDFEGIRIGPEPTTDVFMIVSYSTNRELVPGNSLVVNPNLPLKSLEKYGNKFLARLQGSMLPNDVLKSISFIDTPGILSGSERNVHRGYPYNEIILNLAERVDSIIIMLDAHSLDINTEFTNVIKSLREYDEKIKFVLNKSDQVDNQELMRVYGALMWNLGNVMMVPEVPRVYVSNFSNNPLRYTFNKDLILKEAKDLYNDIMKLPKYSATRKLNSLARRVRLIKVHAKIIGHLKTQMPLFGKEKKKKELIHNLKDIFTSVAGREMSIGDFPNVDAMKKNLEKYDFSKFKGPSKAQIQSLDDFLNDKLPKLVTRTNKINAENRGEKNISGGIFSMRTATDLFDIDNKGINEGKAGDEWIVSDKKSTYDDIFYSLKLSNNKLNGLNGSEYMRKSNLPDAVLGRIWTLSDIDKDGYLDCDEFALASHLMGIAVNGRDIPSTLPDHLIPPSKMDSF